MARYSEDVRKDLIVAKNKTFSAKPRRGISHTLNQEVKTWLQEMVQNHWYLYECKTTGKLRIAFHNNNDAVMFKLAWH